MAEQIVLPKILSPKKPERVRLPDERKSLTHKFVIVGGDKRFDVDENGRLVETAVDLNVYITVGFFADGRLGEIFIKIGKEGDKLSGIYDAFAISISLGLQCGISIDTYIDKFEHTRFEPAGPVKNLDVPIAKSILDYIFRWLKRFSEAERISIIPEDVDNGVSGCSEDSESEQTEGSGTSAVRVCEETRTENKGADEAR